MFIPLKKELGRDYCRKEQVLKILRLKKKKDSTVIEVYKKTPQERGHLDGSVG